jgi:hypothetical protein
MIILPEIEGYERMRFRIPLQNSAKAYKFLEAYGVENDMKLK